jgi:hypothetical protein
VRLAVTIKVADVQKNDEGLMLRVGQRFVPIPKGVTALCPVNAIEQLLDSGLVGKGDLFLPFAKRGRTVGPLDREGVKILLQRMARRIGMIGGICYSSLLLGVAADLNATRALGL